MGEAAHDTRRSDTAFDPCYDHELHNGTSFVNTGEVLTGDAGLVKSGTSLAVEITGGATTNSAQGLAFSASGASGTLGIDTTIVPQKAAANTYTLGPQTVNDGSTAGRGFRVSYSGTTAIDLASTAGVGNGGLIFYNGSGTAEFVLGRATTNLLETTAKISAVGIDAGSQTITSVAAPSLGTDAANKDYVDGVAQGLDPKASVRVVATSNGTLASAYANGQTVDGVNLVTGDRILLAGQSTGSENGIFTVNASGAPTRAADANAAGELSGGTYVWVEEGTTYADTGWVITTNGSITPGTTSHTWTQFTGAAMITAGAGLGKSGNTISITDAELLAIAGLTSAADKVPYFTGSGTASLATLTSQARDLIDDTSFGAMRTTLGAAGLADANTFTVPQIIDLSVTGTALTLDVNTSGDKWISFTESANERGVIAELSDGILVEATDDSLTLKGAGAVNINPVAGVANFNSSRLTSVANATADTDALNRQTGDGRYCRVATGTMGSTAAITITHNFNTRAVITEVYTTSAPYDKVDCTVTHDTVNAVTFTFNSAPSAGAYTYVIMGIDT